MTTPLSTRPSFALRNRSAFEMRKARFYELVGKRITELREAAGMPCSKLATECLVSVSTMRLAESGRSCALPMLAMIADVLDVTMDDIVSTEASDVMFGKDCGEKGEAAE